MQRRYCNCGRMIWVQYLTPNANCRVLFKSAGDSRRSYLLQCPGCGRRLDIDELC